MSARVEWRRGSNRDVWRGNNTLVKVSANMLYEEDFRSAVGAVITVWFIQCAGVRCRGTVLTTTSWKVFGAYSCDFLYSNYSRLWSCQGSSEMSNILHLLKTTKRGPSLGTSAWSNHWCLLLSNLHLSSLCKGFSVAPTNHAAYICQALEFFLCHGIEIIAGLTPRCIARSCSIWGKSDSINTFRFFHFHHYLLSAAGLFLEIEATTKPLICTRTSNLKWDNWFSHKVVGQITTHSRTSKMFKISYFSNTKNNTSHSVSHANLYAKATF